MGIFLGLASAIGWGTGDFLVRGTTRKVGSYVSLFYMQFFGLAFVLVYALATGELAEGLGRFDLETSLLMIFFSVVSLTGTLLLYNAFRVGMLAVVSPIAASYAVVTLVLSTVISGERLEGATAIGVAATIIGVILSSIEKQHTPTPAQQAEIPSGRGFRLPPGVLFAIGCALIYGFIFWMQGFYITPRIGPIMSVLGLRVLAVLLMPILALRIASGLRLPDRRSGYILFAVGVLDTAAFIAASVGLTTEQVSIVTVLSSLFSAWTVLLAWAFLKERPARIQWIGIVLILIGIVLVTLGS
ncbi:MAG: DMT family transporter [Pleurocapsa minor GSE-CHR-MK-17-07R]|jgi:drug/metabolite transporter (DMT)-like permease|nr:DMT family transporter [Pleurocapsa minor GSE-CHR-MK 17-07R]